MKRVANIICKIEVNNNDHIYIYIYMDMTSEDPRSDSDTQNRRDLLSLLSTQPYRKRVSLEPNVKVATSYVCDCKQ